MNGCNKSIPTARDSFNEPGVIGGIFESAAKLFDRSIQTFVEIDKGVLGPQPMTQLFAGDQLSRTFEQHGEYAKRMVLEVNNFSPPEELPGSNVGLEHAKRKQPPYIAGGLHTPAKLRQKSLARCVLLPVFLVQIKM